MSVWYSPMPCPSVPPAHHHRFTTSPHHLRADVRLAAATTAERLVAQDHGVLVVNADLRNKEPLPLPDRLAPPDFLGTQVGERRQNIADAVARHGCGKHHVMRTRLHIQNFDCNLVFTPDDKEFARAIPAYINCDLRPLQAAWSSQNNASAHADEVPTQILLGRHTFPSSCL